MPSRRRRWSRPLPCPAFSETCAWGRTSRTSPGRRRRAGSANPGAARRHIHRATSRSREPRPATLLVDPEQVEEKGVLERALFERFEAAGFAAMPGFHVDVEDERILVGLQRAQASDVFRRLVVLHLRVPQPGADEERR